MKFDSSALSWEFEFLRGENEIALFLGWQYYYLFNFRAVGQPQPLC